MAGEESQSHFARREHRRLGRLWPRLGVCVLRRVRFIDCSTVRSMRTAISYYVLILLLLMVVCVLVYVL